MCLTESTTRTTKKRSKSNFLSPQLKTKPKALEKIFRSNLAMLQREKKIGTELIENLIGLRYNMVSVHAENRPAGDESRLGSSSPVMSRRLRR
jgi:hypothetical protein